MSSRAERPGVLIVAASFDGRGGLQRSLHMLGEGLARRWPVTVLTWKAGGRTEREDRGPRLTIVRVPALAAWDRDHRPLTARVNTAFSVTTGLWGAVRLRHRWSAAYAHGLYPEGLVAALAGRALRRTYVLGTWLPGPLGNVARIERSPVARALKRALGGARAYVAESAEIAEELASAGFPRGRIELLPFGIPLHAFAPAGPAAREEARRRFGIEAPGVVAYHGRFDLRQKRLDLLLEAWRRAGLERWQLLLAGDGPDRSVVERLCDPIRPRPLLPGWLEDVRPVLAAADICVLPTNFEANGLAMVEGMACGLPGLVSDVTIYRGLRPDGVLLVPNEVEAWAQALLRLTGDEEERRKLGRRARAWVKERYDAEATVEAIESLLGV